MSRGIFLAPTSIERYTTGRDSRQSIDALWIMYDIVHDHGTNKEVATSLLAQAFRGQPDVIQVINEDAHSFVADSGPAWRAVAEATRKYKVAKIERDIAALEQAQERIQKSPEKRDAIIASTPRVVRKLFSSPLADDDFSGVSAIESRIDELLQARAVMEANAESKRFSRDEQEAARACLTRTSHGDPWKEHLKRVLQAVLQVRDDRTLIVAGETIVQMALNVTRGSLNQFEFAASLENVLRFAEWVYGFLFDVARERESGMRRCQSTAFSVFCKSLRYDEAIAWGSIDPMCENPLGIVLRQLRNRAMLVGSSSFSPAPIVALTNAVESRPRRRQRDESEDEDNEPKVKVRTISNAGRDYAEILDLLQEIRESL